MARKLRYDWLLFMASFALVALSVVMVYSASSIVAAQRFDDPYYFAAKQIAFVLAGCLVLAVQADLVQTSQLGSLIDTVTAHAGRLDILINNASSFYPTPLASLNEQQWTDLIGTNLKAPLFLAQAALPHLKATRGVIVNIVDIHAVRPLKDHTAYGAAKAGLAFLTRALARDLAPDIRVNGVAPGAILWPDGGVTDSMRDTILRQIPLKRVGEPSDIATCVLYLVRDASYVTGQIIAVDGGRSAGW